MHTYFFSLSEKHKEDAAAQLRAFIRLRALKHQTIVAHLPQAATLLVSDAMQKLKLDFAIEGLSEDARLALDGCKAGENLALSAGDASQPMSCSTLDGQLVGSLPPHIAQQLRFLRAIGSVKLRSLRRGEDGALSRVEVRVEAMPEGRQRPQQPSSSGQAEQALDESGFMLGTNQLERIAHSPELVAMLKDERLQQLLARIDGAADREAALKEALLRDDFREFTDSLLIAVQPE